MQDFKKLSPTSSTDTARDCVASTTTDLTAMTYKALVLDRDAANRAVDFYLSDMPPLANSTPAILATHDGVTLKAVLAHASDVLRQAGVALNGLPKEQMISVMHLIDMAKSCVDTSLDKLVSR